MSSVVFKTDFEVEEYLRSLGSDDIKKSALAWLLKLKHININDNIPKALQKLSKLFIERLLLLNEFNPASKLKKEEAEKLVNDLNELKNSYKEEDLEFFKKFEESAALAIPHACVHNSPVLEYKTDYLILYHNIFLCIYDLVKSLFEGILAPTPVVDAVSCKLLVQFIKIYNDVINKKDEKSIVFRLSEMISQNTKIVFESNNQRDDAIIEVLKSFMLGGPDVHDNRKFVIFWNQVIARNAFYADYIISIANEIFIKYGVHDQSFNLHPIYSMDTETFTAIEDNCFKKTEQENIPRARSTKLIATAIVIATSVISYMNYKKENQ